jgi:hypothetical protein
MRGPTLLDGDDYDVMLRNVWRLLVSGMTLAEVRLLVLAHADVTVFPDPPMQVIAARRSSSTIH